MSKQQIRRIGAWAIVQTSEGITHMFQPQDVARMMLATPQMLHLYLVDKDGFTIRTGSQDDAEAIIAVVIAATTTDAQVKAAAELARTE